MKLGEAKTARAASALNALNPLRRDRGNVWPRVTAWRMHEGAGVLYAIYSPAPTLCSTEPTVSPRASRSTPPAARLALTLISGAVGRWDGQVATFKPGGPCYRCLVPQAPPDAETCAQAGIVGALTGLIGSIMALEAIKEIAGAGETLAGRLLLYDGLTTKSRTVRLPRDPACPECG